MPEADRALLESAARSAGEIARRHFKRDPKVWQKGDQGPVTEADLEVDAMLHDRLLGTRPDYGWLSEESYQTDRRTGQRTFVIDPIDGTRAFIEGNGAFTHSLAVVEDGRTVAAAIYQPMRDRLWSAHAGGGASLNGVPIAPSGRAGLEEATVLAAKPTFRAQNWERMPDVRRTFRSSLAYRLALVAQGRFDAMVTLRDCWHWDIAAGDLICTEAGASCTDRFGSPLHYGTGIPKVVGVIAGSPAVHAGLLDRVATPG
ncbi:inositol monophosphatase family protein [Jannaschia aquimarina]|uniref:SuhB_1 protein n=1 Tax=Jannaschia aquimarina TaxID=935700 RepID=A0A0D1EGB4_9RHOB|nr:3'(2'),5'-bisphosphate nucleotidase CysQ [Jannaschia aquimarina]KIT16694.1 Inositol-1-monophosphatase [Jannaschia aquimarina]SNS54908.1 myo-inositol-1(or 4)-monophosphatase [Jannaschia aquimarina]